MNELLGLWLPIVVSAALVWIAAAIIWMVLPHHKNDWKGLPDEDRFIRALKEMNIPKGAYGFPHCGSHKDGKDPEFQRKWKEGPAGMLNIWGTPNMGMNMALSFVVYLLIGVFVAYIAAAGLGPGAPYLTVFRTAGATAIAIYCLGWLPSAIWFQKPRSAVVADLVDGVVYGLLTAGTFAWLWPDAPAIG